MDGYYKSIADLERLARTIVAFLAPSNLMSSPPSSE